MPGVLLLPTTHMSFEKAHSWAKHVRTVSLVSFTYQVWFNILSRLRYFQLGALQVQYGVLGVKHPTRHANAVTAPQHTICLIYVQVDTQCGSHWEESALFVAGLNARIGHCNTGTIYQDTICSCPIADTPEVNQVLETGYLHCVYDSTNLGFQSCMTAFDPISERDISVRELSKCECML